MKILPLTIVSLLALAAILVINMCKGAPAHPPPQPGNIRYRVSTYSGGYTMQEWITEAQPVQMGNSSTSTSYWFTDSATGKPVITNLPLIIEQL